MNAGLVVIRVVFGLLMAAHGAQKLFGWFGGYGLAARCGFFESLGFRPGRMFAAAAGLSEFGGGVACGARPLRPGRPGAHALGDDRGQSASIGRGRPLSPRSNGIEMPLLYAAAAVALALTGPGRYSLDALLGLTSVWTPGIDLAALAVGVVGGIANLALRRTSAPASVAA